MFKDRVQAGEILADKLFAGDYPNLCLLAIPRGGVVVAAPIALKLKARLGLLITRKIGHPSFPEVAIGAVMPDGSAVWNQALMDKLGIQQNVMAQLLQKETVEIKRRMLGYLGADDPPRVADCTVIVVDDGIATGYTILAAIQWLKRFSPRKLIIAVPVASPDAVELLRSEVDDIICPCQPLDFNSVGMYYKDFQQTEDEEVLRILHQVNHTAALCK